MHDFPPNVSLVDHSLAQHKLTLMRQRARDGIVSREKFRRLMREIGLILCAEVTRSLRRRTVQYSADFAGTTSFQAERLLQHRVVLVPIIRGGLELSDAFLELLPMARVGHLGLFREFADGTSLVTNFFTSIPSGRDETDFFLLDAEINTAQTMSYAVSILLDDRVGVKPHQIKIVTLVACRRGLEAFYGNSDLRFRDVKIFTLAVDDALDEEGVIYPGIGNVGFRLFGTGRSKR